MQCQQNEKETCSFCSSMPPGRKQLLSSLFRALSKQLQNSPVIHQTQASQSDLLPFRQLLRIIFGSELLSSQGQCQHRKYYTQEQYYLRYFIIKLKCNELAFQFACQGLVEKIAEKNYHLQLLSLQVKNAAETIAKGELGLEQEIGDRSEARKGLRKRSSKKSRTTMDNSQREIKVEPEVGKEAELGSEARVERGDYLPVYRSDFAMPEENQLSMNTLNNHGFYFQQFPFFFQPHSQ